MNSTKKIIVDGQEYQIFDSNIMSDKAAFATFSGYMAFSGQLSEEVLRQFGDKGAQLLGKKVNVIFAVSNGVIEGVFDKNMNPDKELMQVVGEAAMEWGATYVAGKAGGAVGGAIGTAVAPGPGTAVGATIGAVLAATTTAVVSSLNSDDWWKNLSDAFHEHQFSFLDEKIYGEMSQDEFYVKELERGNICAKHYPEYLRYRQLTTIDTFPSVLHSDIRQILSYDKESQKAYIKVTDEVTLKEFADLVLQNNKEVREIVINDKLYNMQNENDKATISALQTEHNRLLDEKKEQSAQTANTQQEIQNETSNNEINADNAVQTSDNQQPQTPPISLIYTTPLVYKDFNDKVGELQRGLNFLKEAGEISWDKYLEEDNYFGDETKEALIEFQRANSLKESGNADKATIEALQQKIEHFTPKGKISSDMENFLKQQLGIDEFSDGFKSALAYFQENYSLDDNEIKDMTLNPLVTDEFIEQLAKEQEASEEAEAKRKQEREQEEDNLHYHSYSKG